VPWNNPDVMTKPKRISPGAVIRECIRNRSAGLFKGYLFQLYTHAVLSILLLLQIADTLQAWLRIAQSSISGTLS